MSDTGHHLDRRTLMALGAATAAALPAAKALAAANPPADPTEIIRLWPGNPPGALTKLPTEQVIDRIATSGFQDRYAVGISTPTLTVFRPARPNGAAILVIPGGGYGRVVLDKEAYESARRWNEAGITAFVLRYRLPAEGWANPADTPLQDAQRAMRLIRARAADYKIAPDRIAVLGFSAGGHLVASLATRHAAAVYTPVDAADRLPARPYLAALAYPVMTMEDPAVHRGSREALLGKSPSPEKMAAYSPNKNVPDDMPPTFLFHSADDDVVPVENSLAMYSALRAKRIPAEMHIFEEGGHGFGIRLAAGKPVEKWPELFLRWAARHRFLI